MKNLFLVSTILFLCMNNNASSSDKWGEGELQLDRATAEYFAKYIQGDNTNKKPADFYVAVDGTNSMYWFCPVLGQCAPGSYREDIKACEARTGKKCRKFAVRRTIKWKNGINPAKGKASTFKSNMSTEDVLAKLTELGFYNNSSPSKKKPKDFITKKSNEGKSETIVDQINELNDLYKNKIISKEEFDKAKSIILGNW